MRTPLFIIIVFVALSAALSGVLLVCYPNGGIMYLQLSALEGTAFKNFLVPGLLLAGLVGTPNIIAVCSNMMKSANRYSWAIAGGLMTIGWIVVQYFLIGIIHWPQFIYLGAGLFTILIAYQLKGKWAA